MEKQKNTIAIDFKKACQSQELLQTLGTSFHLFIHSFGQSFGAKVSYTFFCC